VRVVYEAARPVTGLRVSVPRRVSTALSRRRRGSGRRPIGLRPTGATRTASEAAGAGRDNPGTGPAEDQERLSNGRCICAVVILRPSLVEDFQTMTSRASLILSRARSAAKSGMEPNPELDGPMGVVNSAR
jgi:hypothetical protein